MMRFGHAEVVPDIGTEEAIDALVRDRALGAEEADIWRFFSAVANRWFPPDGSPSNQSLMQYALEDWVGTDLYLDVRGQGDAIQGMIGTPRCMAPGIVKHIPRTAGLFDGLKMRDFALLVTDVQYEHSGKPMMGEGERRQYIFAADEARREGGKHIALGYAERYDVASAARREQPAQRLKLEVRAIVYPRENEQALGIYF